MTSISSPLVGTIVRVAAPGTEVPAGGEVAVVESMKMEYSIDAPSAGVVQAVHVSPGDAVAQGDALLDLGEATVAPTLSTRAASSSSARSPSPPSGGAAKSRS